MLAKPIYVEIRVHSSIEELWKATQTPELHQRWDLRFSGIEYIPRTEDTQAQRFKYSTRIGIGLDIRGEGETVGERGNARGEFSSALKFWSDDPKSLIKQGSGYWKYVPTHDGVRFLTQYDYTTRFGPAGRWLDRLVFRPLIGWATAWSFDRLRLWLEKGIRPEDSFLRSVVHFACRWGLALTWIYQGLVPKLLFKGSGELDILRGVEILRGHEASVLILIGVGEILFGVFMLPFRNVRPFFIANLIALPLLALSGLLSRPSIYLLPFNPFAVTLPMMVLSLIGWLCSQDLPSSAACSRRSPLEER